MYENRSEWRARVFGLRLRFIGEARVEHCLKFKLGNPLPAPIPSAEIQTTTAPDTMADVAEVKDAFESQGYTLDSKVIADEAFALCRQFNLDAFDLALHWDGFSVEQASKKAEAKAEGVWALDFAQSYPIGKPSRLRDAFAAADYLMDHLKSAAWLWKRERRADGWHWIEPRSQDHADLARWK